MLKYLLPLLLLACTAQAEDTVEPEYTVGMVAIYTADGEWVELDVDSYCHGVCTAECVLPPMKPFSPTEDTSP